MRTLIMIALALTVACTTSSNVTKPMASAEPGTAQQALYGDAAFKKRLAEALSAKGPDYEPRTKHKNADGSPKYTNRLILETSPYLHQHAHNPVNWFPWGDEAFDLAKQLGRPVFLSIGYTTCHWCHVMEEESFEDEEIARYLNDNYIAIKVDREERPDVDAVYMRAVTMMHGSGGWPMSVWLTPSRQPFHGGTYYPARPGDRGAAKGFIDHLQEQRANFESEGDRVAEEAKNMAARIDGDFRPQPPKGQPGPATILRAIDVANNRFDPDNGGARSRRTKFPSSFPVRLLLRFALRSGDERARHMALFTLEKMQAGGMYDHIGGGFHRYSTDPYWLVPHFEKMLYDNALLALAYLDAYQLTGDKEHERVAREILDYIIADMQSPEGPYYSATDADSIGPKGHREEGYYFTWTQAELDAALGTDLAATIAAYYNMTKRGNFEGRNILHTPKSRDDIARELSMDRGELDAAIASARSKLLAVRGKRPAPIRDEKIQVDWNGLMITAMAHGARVFHEPRYGDSAKRAGSFLLTKLVEGGRLKHSYKDGQTTTTGFCEDYAFFAAGLIELFEYDADPRWLAEALTMMNQLEQHHRGPHGGYFRTADDAEKLLAREMTTHDGAQPNGNSWALMNQLKLSALTTDDAWRQRAVSTMKAFAGTLEQSPWSANEMMLAIDFHSDAAKEVVVVLPEGADRADPVAAALVDTFRKRFVPNAVFVMAELPNLAGQLGTLVPWAKGKPAKKDKPTAYVCELGACDLPTSDPTVFAEQITKVHPYPGPLGGG